MGRRPVLLTAAEQQRLLKALEAGVPLRHLGARFGGVRPKTMRHLADEAGVERWKQKQRIGHCSHATPDHRPTERRRSLVVSVGPRGETAADGGS